MKIFEILESLFFDYLEYNAALSIVILQNVAEISSMFPVSKSVNFSKFCCIGSTKDFKIKIESLRTFVAICPRIGIFKFNQISGPIFE